MRRVCYTPQSDSARHMSPEMCAPRVWTYALTCLVPFRRGVRLTEPSANTKSTSKLDPLGREGETSLKGIAEVNFISD